MHYKSLALSVCLMVSTVTSFPAFAARDGIVGAIRGRTLINSEPAARAVVYLKIAGGPSAPWTTPDQIIRQENLRFIPDFLVVPAGTTVLFENHDDEIHNIYSKSESNRFDTGAHLPGTIRKITLNKPGPVVLHCRTHENMRGMIYVVPSPYFSVTDENGDFEIADVPAGDYPIAAWHPRLTPHEQEKAETDLHLEGKVVTVTLNLQAGTPSGTDLSDTPDRDWHSTVEEIRNELTKCLGLWKNGGTTAAAARVMKIQSQLYGESGFRKAIAAGLGRDRADEHERRLDSIRKRIQGIGGSIATESELRGLADRAVEDLRRDADLLTSPE